MSRINLVGGGLMLGIVGLGWMIGGYFQGEPYWSLAGGVAVSTGLVLIGFFSED